MTLQEIKEIVTALISVFGIIGIWLQIQNYKSKRRFDKIDLIERTQKVIETYGDEGLKRLDKELTKDDLFSLRTGIEFTGKLRRAFVNEFDDLINSFGFGQLFLIRTYFRTVDDKLSVKSKKDMFVDNLLAFVFWGFIALLLFSLLILSYILETPDWARLVIGLLAGLSCIPILKQIVILKLIAKVRRHLADKYRPQN